MTAAPLDLDALEAAEKAATPGPWYLSLGIGVYFITDGQSNLADDPDEADGTFIASLRNAAPALFAAARERERYKELNRELVNTHNKNVVWLSRRDDEIIRLREALEAAEPILLAESMGLPGSIERADQTRDALAKARAALGKPSVTSSTSDPSPK